MLLLLLYCCFPITIIITSYLTICYYCYHYIVYIRPRQSRPRWPRRWPGWRGGSLEGGGVLLTEMLLPRSARRGAACPSSRRGQARKALELRNVTSMRVFVRGKPNSDTSGFSQRTENSESEFCTGSMRVSNRIVPPAELRMNSVRNSSSELSRGALLFAVV